VVGRRLALVVVVIVVALFALPATTTLSAPLLPFCRGLDGEEEPFTRGLVTYNLAADWGSAGGFPARQFGATVNAQLPLGVFLTGTMSTSSGRHYNITTGRDDNRDTQVNDRPPGLRRNSGVAAGQLTFGFNISKAFFFDAASVTTRKNLNVFANMTNAFNRTNFGNPSGVMTSPAFGRPTSAGDPREIEVGMRYQF